MSGLLAFVLAQEQPALDWITQLGYAGVFALAVWAFLARRVITRRELDERLGEKDEQIEGWRQLALRGTDQAGQGIDLADKAATKAIEDAAATRRAVERLVNEEIRRREET